MCSPAAITAVQTGMNIAGTVLQASAQDEHAKEVWKNAGDNLATEYNQTQLKEQQEMERTSQQIINAQRTGATTAGRVRVRAAQGNITGATANEQVQDVENRVSDFSATAKRNLAGQLEQAQMEAQGFRARTESIINENQPVSPLALGLDIGTEVLQGANKDVGFKPPVGGATTGTPDVAEVGFTNPAAGLNITDFGG